MRRIDSADELLAEMRAHLPRRIDVYLSPPNGTWHLTYTGGVVVNDDLVRALVQRGTLVRTYSDCPDCYCLGPTIDVAATKAARAQHGKTAPLVYVQPQT